ncbi:MAG: LTA synthase family protein, partial [Alistipes sp.]|nr:LTA synthase family protein [Alistipes sp.]
MKRKLLLAAAIWATTVVLMALQKPVFLLYYAAEASQSTFGEWMQVVWHGLKLDMTVAGYITALPILFLLVNLWVSIPDRIGRKILGWYLTLMAVVAAALFAVDLGLYEYWGFRLDSTLLIYLSDPKEARASVDGWMAVRQTLIWAVYAALMCGVYWRVVRLYDGRSLCWCRALPWSVVMLLVAGLDFLSIRGGVGTSVANVSKVCFSPTPFLNHAAVNPIFSFLSTLGKQ